MDKDALVKVEKQRLELQDQVTKLRKALRHWQTWEIEYEGLKEEILLRPATSSSKDLLDAAKDFKAELVDDDEINSLLGLNTGRPPRSQQQIADVISRRIEYVSRNSEIVQKQLAEAERRRNSLLLAEHDDTREDAGLPMVEITEELDDEGNVIPSSMNTPARNAPQLLDVLQQAGVREILENDGVIKTVRNENTNQQGPLPGKQVASISEPVAISPVSGESSLSSGDDNERVDALESSKDVVEVPDASSSAIIDSRSVAPVSAKVASNTSFKDEKESFNATVPSDDSEDDATLRKEMIDYQSGLNEVGQIVAELNIEDGPEYDSYADDLDDLMDDDDELFDETESEESEDEYGRSKKSPITDTYRQQMMSLERKLNVKDIQNLGPQPNLPEEVRRQLDKLTPASTPDLSTVPSDLTPVLSNISKSEPEKRSRKQVAFAEELDIAPSESGAPTDPKVNFGKPQENSKMSRFKQRRMGTATPVESVEESSSRSSQSPTLKKGKTLADVVVERPIGSAAQAPSFDDIDDRMHAQEIASEYRALRNRMIHRQGGFVEEREQEQEKVPLPEDMGGKKMSRFKAARLK
ncbi:putative udp-galactose transporter like protein [Phaeomoniella chlamydospora]|uniref:Putative udp-galactose transporter like protein n=1 Tax=Phaeomoniella chlamydospora TaxID=158046 RepID=A0A0G2E4P5_PHACM|nr:putative udp-galactose transporter like protein [Phaeomoniella chlamydospora]